MRFIHKKVKYGPWKAIITKLNNVTGNIGYKGTYLFSNNSSIVAKYLFV